MFVLDLLELEYKDCFENIAILCLAIKLNKSYNNRRWIGYVKNPKDKRITIKVDPLTRVCPKGKVLKKLHLSQTYCNSFADPWPPSCFHYTPANFVCGGYTVFTLSVRPSVTLCFLNILKSHCWIFIKPCKHVYIC